jgi:hypothetical protein|tara:strand:+ start:190 stop:381 length:192 start_codon:yes stop_codon:yes gene_type:complete
MKFSDCVNEFVSLWVTWLKYNDIAINKNEEASNRRSAAISAEKLLNRRYKLVEEINKHFNRFD